MLHLGLSFRTVLPWAPLWNVAVSLSLSLALSHSVPPAALHSNCAYFPWFLHVSSCLKSHLFVFQSKTHTLSHLQPLISGEKMFQVSWKPGRCALAWSSWRRRSETSKNCFIFILYLCYFLCYFLWYFYGIWYSYGSYGMSITVISYGIDNIGYLMGIWNLVSDGKELRREASGWHSKKMQQLRRLQATGGGATGWSHSVSVPRYPRCPKWLQYVAIRCKVVVAIVFTFA